ncbi:[4Fe-4S] proteins maturation [Purpureocillium takamizusanense]|uniref:[4Fe-4S] proteins maturation n=1 Tax=Purpureocillium takamizusanense TaxID=2060973 RepID=A0A9Q8QFM5_9HYPO|nr:[4Fe-4S] proteins maturation [Purpureocillium takamizusanense]UNI18001.1 [4Fe-4S] proteins maturation [Purpureocillium takamizusanense]
MTPLRCVNGASAARSFVQVASRGYSTGTAYATVLPDFLVPRGAAFVRRRIDRTLPRAPCSSSRPSRSSHMSSPTRACQIRNFSASVVHNATTCVLNPQKDEDGKDMVLEITPRAAKRLSDIMKKDDNPNLALRIQVESGGCHGFQYMMSLVTIPAQGAEEWSSVVNEDDSIFQYTPDEAESTPSANGPRIILDEPSLDLLKGSKVDFTMELIGSQFKIVDNPYATSSCGCGTSFDIKM